MEFTSNDEQLSKVIARLGRVSTSYLFPMLSCAEGSGLSRGKVGHKSTFTVIAKDRNGEPCTTGRCYGNSPANWLKRIESFYSSHLNEFNADSTGQSKLFVLKAYLADL